MQAALAFELRFQSLFQEGRALAFPCDAAGSVDVDALSERARCNYVFACKLIGRDYATPAVLPRLAERDAQATVTAALH